MNKLRASDRLRKALPDEDRIKVKARRAPEASATVTISGSQECVDRVLAFLGVLNNNGGHSGIFGISWDGDGSDAVHVEGKDFDPADYGDLTNALSSYGAAVEYVAEGCTGFVLNNDSTSSYPKQTKVFPEKTS